MEKYYLYAFIILAILIIICFIVIYKLYSIIKRIQKKQKNINDMLCEKDIKDLLYDIFCDEKILKEEIQSIYRELSIIRDKQEKCFDKIKIIRYHNGTDNEAKLSYSVGISNENGDGLVITGLQYRQGCNMYYKEINKGVPDFELSKEEKLSINRADARTVMMNKKG